MPNLFSKIFRRKNGEPEKDALVEQHTTGTKKPKKTKERRPSPRRTRKASTQASTTSSATTEVAANKGSTDASNNKSNATKPLSPKNTSPPRPSSPSGKKSTSTSILHQNNVSSSSGFEFAPSTASTSKTSDRDSPPILAEDDEPAKRSPSARGGRSPTNRVLSPRNSTSSPPSRGSSGPVDLDDENSDDDENMMRRNNVTAIPIFTMDGTGASAPPHLMLNKPEDLNDDGSSFNLSTDAEDTEYENLKRGVVPPSSLDQSVASTYKSDGETSVFPNLVDEDTTAEEDTGFSAAWDPTSPIHDFPATTTASTATSTNNTSTTSGNVSGFPSPPPFKSTRPSRQQAAKAAASPPSTPFQDDFANFADFANFDSQWPAAAGSGTKSPTPSTAKSTTSPASQPPTSPSKKPTSKVYIETGKLSGGSSTRGEQATSAASLSTRETSLTELLAQAKSKSSRRSASSVNSAPVTSSYLRRDGSVRRLESRSTADGGATAASVSDIIQNLDSAAKERDVGSVKSAKERLKQRRHQKESDESADEAAESWLFDEVTGALGPRGIAADLESLSGRSHQSKGDRSHKSHRSSKSKRRSRRTSSGESVTSRDSKRSSASRRSRSSRYSHRSTKSYISQMSEQSRSVANDLLRLEMQLAMVGQQQSQGQPNESREAEPTKSSSGADGGHRSSRSRTSNASGRRSTSSSARRSRITVMAPPGKLGIILANKADSKGTVVSGVRTSSVLAEKISPGDRIVAIDGEDVSLMTVSEITTIMARKADFERTLTVLTTPRTTSVANSEASSSQPPSSTTSNSKYRN